MTGVLRVPRLAQGVFLWARHRPCGPLSSGRFARENAQENGTGGKLEWVFEHFQIFGWVV